MPLKQYIANDCLNIFSFRDTAVKEYYAWQQSQVKEPALKAEYQTICGVILKEGIDLELIREDLDLDFLVKKKH